MKFNDFNNRVLLEGGNVTINDQSADRIDSNAREQAVPLIDNGLKAINAAFAQYSGRPLWHPELLKSRAFLSGSAFHFFDRENISDLKFVAAKPTVGDIDTQVDADMRDEIIAWLQKLPAGSRLGDAVYLGLKDDPISLGGAQLITLWNFPGIQIKTKRQDGSTIVRGTNVQIDLELKEFETRTGTSYRQPTRWSAFSASSSWDDLQSGVKGVFHKYLIMALTRLTEQNVIIRKPVYNRKTKQYDSYKYSAPTIAPMYTFAVGSREGGGLRPTLTPALDSTGKQEEIDNVPVYDPVGATGYTRDIDAIFSNIFGKRLKRSDLKKISTQFDSFTGLLAVMKKYLSAQERQVVANKFREKIIGTDEQGRRAQELYKGDAKKDRTEKLTAYNLLNQTLGTTAPAGFDAIVTDYYNGYDKGAGVGESLDEADAPNYRRVGIKHIYNPGSSVELSDKDFIELCKEIADLGGKLDQVPINLKVDGAGIRFGRDQQGTPFFMTSKVTDPIYPDRVGMFADYARQQGAAPDRIEFASHYDRALDIIVNSKFINRLPPDTIVQAEMLFNQMGQKTDKGIKFVNISYNPKQLGSVMTLVPILIKEYSTGQTRPDADKIKKDLIAASDSKIKFVNNKLEHRGIDVRNIIQPVLSLTPEEIASLKNKKATSELKNRTQQIISQARQNLSQAIISSPKLKGMDQLGKNIEGLVVNMPGGMLVKVTTPEMKSAVAAKQAVQKPSKPSRTAVVAIGNFAGHRGHEELWKYTRDHAKSLNGDPYLFIGRAYGVDDPIPVDTKVSIWHKLYPEYSKNISAVMDGGSIMQKIKHELISPQPGKAPRYDNIIIMVGEDQARMPIAGALMKAVNRFPGYEHVKVSLEPTPRGTGMSTTRLRNVLKTGTPQEQFALWRSAYSQKLSDDDINDLIRQARHGMQLPDQTGSDKLAHDAAANIGQKMKETQKKPMGPKFTGYFQGKDRPPVGKRLVGEQLIRPGDIVRTNSHRGIVESIEYYRPFGCLAVYFRDATNNLMRTPINNVIKIPSGE